MTAPELEARILAWARSRPDVEAVVQIGSRAQRGGVVDAWSDWDYQVMVRNPERFRNREWPNQIAPCWSAHFERTERGVTKLSALFAGGLEVDFVLLSAWQIKLVCFAMRHPRFLPWYPGALRRGIHNLRLVVRPGYRVLLGGPKWEQRLSVTAHAWPDPTFSSEDFTHHVTGFWRHAVWVAKKIMRGELRAASRWMQVELRKHTFALLEEEARLEGRTPRPEARQAEAWLDGTRLAQTAQPVEIDQSRLAASLLGELKLFDEVSRKVASHHGFAPPDHTSVEQWLRTELSRITD